MLRRVAPFALPHIRSWLCRMRGPATSAIGRFERAARRRAQDLPTTNTTNVPGFTERWGRFPSAAGVS